MNAEEFYRLFNSSNNSINLRISKEKYHKMILGRNLDRIHKKFTIEEKEYKMDISKVNNDYLFNSNVCAFYCN